MFNEKFIELIERKKSLVCVGLDPDPNRMPVSDTVEFCTTIVDSVQSHVSAIKPNLAFFEALGIDGLNDLKTILDYVYVTYPDLIVIGDGKRGDIGSTSSRYAEAMFDYWGFHAITVNAFAGFDSVKPFLEYQDKGVFVWCKSSNPDGAQIQDLLVEGPKPERFYKRLAGIISDWNSYSNVGLVVGATYPDELIEIREVCPDMPILVPGVGSQSGDLKGSLEAGLDKKYPNLLINSSRSIIYASEDVENYGTGALTAAKSLKTQIDFVLSNAGRSFD